MNSVTWQVAHMCLKLTTILSHRSHTDCALQVCRVPLQCPQGAPRWGTHHVHHLTNAVLHRQGGGHVYTPLHSCIPPTSRGVPPPPPVFGPDTHVCSRVHTLGSWSKKDLACHGNSGNTSSARVWRRSPPPTSTPPPPLAYALLLTHARVHMACATPWRCIP